MTRVLRGSIILVALYSMGVFASASTIAQISAASNTGPGIWVKLCASGKSMFIPLDNFKGGEVPDEAPAPGSTSSACHACVDRRFGDNPEMDEIDT